MKKSFPKIKSKKEFLKFVENNDLSDYLTPQDLVPVKFELKKQDKLISIRLSSELLKLLKEAAIKHKTKYQKLIRLMIENNITHYL